MNLPTHIDILCPACGTTALIEANIVRLQQWNPVISFRFILSQIKGFASARQTLLNQSTSDFILWMDSDIELQENPLPALYECLNGSLSLVGVVPRLIYHPSDWITQGNALFCNYAYDQVTHCEAFERYFDFGLYRGDICRKEGHFDPQFNAGREDLDFYLGLRTKGYRSQWCGDVTVLHHVHSARHFQKILQYDRSKSLLESKYPTSKIDYPVPPKQGMGEKLLWLWRHSRGHRLSFYCYLVLRRACVFLAKWRRPHD
jgi:GT2 family glycosyltransferase